MEWKKFIESYNESLYPEDILLHFEQLLNEKSPYQLKSKQFLYRGIYAEEPFEIHNQKFVHKKTIASSWTKSIDVAQKFANRGSFGIVIAFEFTPDQTIVDFDQIPSNLKYKEELEVLVKPEPLVCDVVFINY